MCKALSQIEMKEYKGGVVSWITALCIAGGVAAVYKLLFSGRGSVSIGPFRATWGN